MVCAISIAAASELRGITGTIEPPVEITGNSIHLVRATPITEVSNNQDAEIFLPFFDPPSEYNPTDTLSCSFVVPDKSGIYAAMVSLTDPKSILQGNSLFMEFKEALTEQLIEALKEWKNKTNRKPVVIRGTRQTGKTWLMKEFSHTYYK